MDNLTVDQEIQFLREQGYYVDNLWQVDDVLEGYDCEDEETAQQILDDALTNGATMEQIWLAIDISADRYGVKSL